MSVATNSYPGASPTGYEYVDGLIWGSSWNLGTSVGGPVGTLTYSFGDSSVNGFADFLEYEKQAFRNALNVIERYIPIKFVEVNFLAPQGTPYYENISWGLITLDDLGGSLAAHQVPGMQPVLQDQGIDTLFGWFAYDTVLFSQAALSKGGAGFETILHEILHGLGLAHPHDAGGSSTIFDGVTQEFGDYGTDAQNQGVYTIMSYNSGYAEVVPVTSYKFGHSATPMALDIAALQAIYGTSTYRTGDNVYKINGSNGAGTFWSAIWDTAGTDTISAAGVTRKVVINLNDADLEGHDAGGSPSSANGVAGGFTIANTVIIENAIGGLGSDILIGNEYNNTLSGSSGHDVIAAGAGDDTVIGGAGKDVIGGGAGADILNGGGGDDKFNAKDGDGNDTFHGGVGIDWIRYDGTTAVTLDLFEFGAQDTGYGVDIIRLIENVEGSEQNDVISGNGQANTIIGNGGDDVLDGYLGRDVLIGATGNDTLIGGNGWDFLNGGRGDDTLIGGQGLDTMTGGANADVFVFNSTSDSSTVVQHADWIRDFKPGEDKIDLSAIDASTVLAGDDSFIFNGENSATDSDEGEVYFVKLQRANPVDNRTYVYVDTDGDKEPEMLIKLTGLHDLTANDFIL